MIKFFMAAVMLLSIASLVDAQGFAVTAGPNGISTTVPFNGTAISTTQQEGYLRGMGAYYNGLGSYYHELGIYENLHEQARSQYLQNHMLLIKQRMELKEIAAEKQKQAREAAITREEEALNMRERRFALEKRKEEMREKGLLPKIGKPSIGWKGHQFGSLDEFKKSPQWIQLQAERDQVEKERAAEELDKQERQEKALEVLRKHRNKSSVDWHRMEQLQRAKEILGEK